MVAINKPSGLLVHRSAIDRHETRFALQLLRDQLGQKLFPVHRLDKPTSGVLLFALSSDIARILADCFAKHTLQKTYLAVVRGFCPEHGSIDHPLKPKFDKFSDRSKNKDKAAQTALTHYRTIATRELPVAVDKYPQSRYSLVEAQPQTGRKHQLRRHFKHIAHPIIGDPKHGKSAHNYFFQQQFGCHRLLLASTRLVLPHPVSGKRIEISAGLDGSFERVLAAMEWPFP